MRTVASFTGEEILLKKFDKLLEKPKRLSYKKGNYAGVAFAFSQFIMFGMYAVVFWVAGILHKEENLKLDKAYAAIFAIMFAAFGAGNGM